MIIRLLLLLFSGLSVLAAEATTVADAIQLYRQKRYPEARVAFERIVAREPANAEACYYLGMTLRRRGDANALNDALPWMQKAAGLAPNNAEYLADFGGMSLLSAAQHNSLGAATRGRDAMEKSLQLDPENLDARDGLIQFYLRAPWPLGKKNRANFHLEEMRKRDPTRATVIEVLAKTNAREYGAAFKLCEDVLTENPHDYAALYHYGRTAALSGENLPRGLSHLEKCLSLVAPGPAAPPRASIWQQIGLIQEKLGHPKEARTAYETSLKLDPFNQAVKDSLVKLP